MIAIRVYNKKGLNLAKRSKFELVDVVCPCCEREIKDITIKSAQIILTSGQCFDCKSAIRIKNYFLSFAS